MIFLFIFWKKLKEDYSGEIIFSSGFFILAGILLGHLISVWFLPNWFFWLEFAGVIIGLAASAFKFKVRVYEVLEAIVISLFPWIAIIFLVDSVNNSSAISFVAFLVCLGLIFLYYFFDLKYKGLSWYKSGRVGFSGLATLGIFFLIRSSVAIFLSAVLSFSGKAEVLVSGSLAFVTFLLIYNLARKE